MNSREKILEAVLKNQPATTGLPDISMFKGDGTDALQKYMAIFKTIGGTVYMADTINDIKELINKNFDISKRIVTTLPELGDAAEIISTAVDPHSYEDVELAVIKGEFCVAENGAIWLTEDLMGQRIIPYICQHLAVVVQAENIVPTLHEAYERIGSGNYGFSGFIGGPSKTADIEQALVLGA
ncbi:MAG: LUD domain-containing protein, partial [Bacteroidota bacterium]